MLSAADVIAFTVPTFPEGGSRYPSVNGMWATGVRYGAKTPEYVDLFRAVRRAAQDAMAATGWQTATEYVEVHLRRYVTTRRQSDAGNLGKCELDALRTWKHGEDVPGFTGVYADDHFARPVVLDVIFDPTPGAVDRIAIACFRVAFADVTVRARRKAQAKREPLVVTAASSVASTLVTGAPTGRHAFLNGRRIPMADALALVEREGRR